MRTHAPELDLGEAKVCNLRTIEGRPNSKVIDYIREAERQFLPYPEFVGLALRGSLIRGYSTEDSDADLIVLGDSKFCPDGPQLNRLFEVARDISSERRASCGSVKNINIERTTNMRDGWPNTDVVADIFRIVTGDKINAYRRHWIERLRARPVEEKDQILKSMAGRLADDDAAGWEKMAVRLSRLLPPSYDECKSMGLTYEEWRYRVLYRVIDKYGISRQNDYQQQRKSLWLDRLHCFVEEPDESPADLSVDNLDIETLKEPVVQSTTSVWNKVLTMAGLSR